MEYCYLSLPLIAQDRRDLFILSFVSVYIRMPVASCDDRCLTVDKKSETLD